VSDAKELSTTGAELDVVRPEGRTLINVRKGSFGAQGDTSGYEGLTKFIYAPAAAQRPYGGWFDEVVDVLEELLGDKAEAAIEAVVIDRDQLTLHIAREHLVEVCKHLRDDQDLRFEFCLGVSGVHYPAHAGRELHAVYPIQSITHNRRLREQLARTRDLGLLRHHLRRSPRTRSHRDA